MVQTIWTTRIFNFDFPAGMFPVIISRLRGAYPRIKQIAEKSSAEQLINRIGGKWSIQEQIGHLIDLEELHHGRIYDFQNNANELRAWEVTNKKTFEADHNSRNIQDLLSEFSTARESFVADLLKFKDDELIKTALHPRIQKQMRVVDMAFFVAEHDDHHIAKMWEIFEMTEG
ncbi:MAG: DinB family protein [Chitinophagales bacterium]